MATRTSSKYPIGLRFIIRSGIPDVQAKTQSTQFALPSTRRDRWTDDAACTTVPLEVFYGTDEKPITNIEKEQAKDICYACPVRRECLIVSIETNEYWGIWGGVDERERRAFIREHGGPTKAAALVKKNELTL